MREVLDKSKDASYLVVKLVSFGVLLNGILIILIALVGQFIRHDFHSTEFSIEVYLLVGITLIYLSNLLWRGKHTAWVFTLIIYAFYLLFRLEHFSIFMNRNHSFTIFFFDLILPTIIIVALLFNHKAYNVRSDVRSFGVALRVSLIVIAITLVYGIAGFQLMDTHDFHHEISFSESVHRTIDQFGLTTDTQLVPYTRRARIFLDSLNVISLAAIGYVLLSLFQPLKARYEDQTANRERARRLLESGHNNSEDIFKLWPQDKYYYFNTKGNAGLAFDVHRGIAIVVGDPMGAVAEYKQLIIDFSEFCRINDWLPAFVHTQGHFNPLYEELGFTAQKIGEEAVVNTAHFVNTVLRNKYFRNINNKFKKQDYSFEVLKPPHSDTIVNRLREISDDWLTQPGRTERKFIMGYFSNSYIQRSDVLVVKDKDQTIQAFLNQIQSFDKDEANFDMLRHSHNSLGNINDFVMLNFIEYAYKQGFKRVNMGLCPLVGLDKKAENRTIIDNGLSFLYANGDRFYSFSGLYRFKEKYEPKWSDRFIIYKNGISGLTRTFNSLNIAMKVHKYTKK